MEFVNYYPYGPPKSIQEIAQASYPAHESQRDRPKKTKWTPNVKIESKPIPDIEIGDVDITPSSTTPILQQKHSLYTDIDYECTSPEPKHASKTVDQQQFETSEKK